MIGIPSDETTKSLVAHSHALAEYWEQSNHYAETDPRTSAMKTRQFIEHLAECIIALRGEMPRQREDLRTKVDRLRTTIPNDLVDLMQAVVTDGNRATHDHERPFPESLARRILENARRIASWFIRFMEKHDANLARPQRRAAAGAAVGRLTSVGLVPSLLLTECWTLTKAYLGRATADTPETERASFQQIAARFEPIKAQAEVFQLETAQIAWEETQSTGD